MNQAWAGLAHIAFLGYSFIPYLDDALELSARDNGVFIKQYPLPIYKPFDQYELYFYHEVSGFLK